MKKKTEQTVVRPGRSGFTLIELLVVIAIIAILAALLLPALTAAKIRAQAVIDISNCKQTMVATAMYCGDNSDILPNPGWINNPGSVVNAISMTNDCWCMSANKNDDGNMGNSHTLANFDKD
jgi:prepilin-type N-terminal cleavage/methylation domain-containing protein